ncbi:zinc finger CCCH domain-containing protein 53-like isoform X1 [Zingiber officinale]|uniref:Zinc finger CCCH domain-containing protein 53 n=1 Tax=Zingiber officinale TaxID=94328 RepID=A0A8J5KLK3_ZINOF|nr:zinc finger CCCH domain-containing protein 53-like isoform X1 [Zingiber officinale]KAG6481473.1 hypothetical protein ZIOFF_058077 [Zingiber officinale]
MDGFEATRVVMSRIQALDSENAHRIMRLLLMQEHGQQGMIHLAFAPDALFQSVVVRAGVELGVATGTTSAAASPVLLGQNSWAPPPSVLSRSNSGTARDGLSDEQWSSDELVSPNNLGLSPFYGGVGSDLMDELFLGDYGAAARKSDPNGGEPFHLGIEHRGPSGNGMKWGTNGHHHDRSSSGDGFAWKPCVYFARGYCKNGNACRFLHGLPEDGASALKLMASAFPFSPTGSVPPSPSSFSSQRATTAEAVAAMMLAGEESHNFMGRTRTERGNLMTTNPGSRQIYLTFPADSTFTEQDVSNYFSNYGPVQDVRIPFQQKRMFGFVTFVYSETVKLIFSMGNPHNVCDSRVLVKPYKEKIKNPDKFRKQQQQQQVQTFDHLQQLAVPMLSDSGSYNHELLLRRKLQEQQQAVELQRSIELQWRRFSGLQLDLSDRSLSSASASINSPFVAVTRPISSMDSSSSGTNSPREDKSPRVAEPEEKTNNFDKDDGLLESIDHGLPDSPFASPIVHAGFTL